MNTDALSAHYRRYREAMRRAAGFLARIKYKPGWTFKLVESHSAFDQFMADGMVHVLITYKAPDSNGIEPGLIKVGRKLVFNEHVVDDEDAFFQFLWMAIIEQENHEQKEFFMIDGVRVRQPHDRLVMA